MEKACQRRFAGEYPTEKVRLRKYAKEDSDILRIFSGLSLSFLVHYLFPFCVFLTYINR